jgi:hypothetical protein
MTCCIGKSVAQKEAAPFGAATSGSERVSALDDPDKDQYDSDHEEDIDEPSDRIGRYQTQGPQNQQDDRNGE